MFLFRFFYHFKKILTFFFILFFFCFLFFNTKKTFAINNWYEGYQINNGTSAKIYIEGNALCKIITNNSGSNIFVPTKTINEWDSFYNHLPPSITTSNCLIGVVLSWSTTAAVQCVASGDWSGPKPTTGNEQFNTIPPKTFCLECFNAINVSTGKKCLNVN